MRRARVVDLLVHRLGGLDLTDTVRVGVSIVSESGGAPLVEVPDALFDREPGEVLVACQQHFRSLPHDIVVRVTTREGSGRAREVVFFVPHLFSP